MYHHRRVPSSCPILLCNCVRHIQRATGPAVLTVPVKYYCHTHSFRLCRLGLELFLGLQDLLHRPGQGLAVPAAGHPGEGLGHPGRLGTQLLNLLEDGVLLPHRFPVAAEEGELFLVGQVRFPPITLPPSSSSCQR